MPTWVGSPEKIYEGPEAEQLLTKINDAKYYTNPTLGITKVDKERLISQTLCQNYCEIYHNKPMFMQKRIVSL